MAGYELATGVDVETTEAAAAAKAPTIAESLAFACVAGGGGGVAPTVC